jgi:predicted GTPase
MREELREAYVERMSETDHQILWHRQMTDEDEELSAHAKRHIEYLLKNLADEFDEKLNLTLSEMDEKGISEDEFMAFDIMIQTAMIAFSAEKNELEEKNAEWEYWSDCLEDNISQAIHDDRPWN